MSILLTGAESTVSGNTTMPFDRSKAPAIVHLLQASGVQYGLGCKPKTLSASPPIFQDESEHHVFGGGIVGRVDCSGFHRYVVFHASGGLIIPDGTTNQNDWYAHNNFRHHEIPDAAAGSDYTSGLDPAHAYVCFLRAGRRGHPIGHVWFLLFLNGGWHSFESHGGSGPDSRNALSPILTHICTDIYAIA